MWYWATKDAEKPSDKTRFEASLYRPPPGKEAQGIWSPEAENAAFKSLKAGLTK